VVNDPDGLNARRIEDVPAGFPVRSVPDPDHQVAERVRRFPA